MAGAELGRESLGRLALKMHGRTETLPVAPLDWLTDSLAEATRCPVWSVDTACVVPMPMVGVSAASRKS